MVLSPRFEFKGLKKKIDSIIYYISVKQDKDSRKVVLHNKNSRTQKPRGLRNATSRTISKTKNSDVKERLAKEHKFDIFKDAFDKQKNPSSKLSILASFMLSDSAEDQRRAGNGLVAIVKNYMNEQKWKKNTKTTEKAKGFNKFGIDSGQLQQSIGWNVSFSRKK